MAWLMRFINGQKRSMGEVSLIPVQVIWAAKESVILIDLEVAAGSTIKEVIEQSGILEQAPEIDLVRNRVGIFGKCHTFESPVAPRDRIEIYRPLTISSAKARRLRARTEPKKR